jgi:hypothetical protein
MSLRFSSPVRRVKLDSNLDSSKHTNLTQSLVLLVETLGWERTFIAEVMRLRGGLWGWKSCSGHPSLACKRCRYGKVKVVSNALTELYLNQLELFYTSCWASLNLSRTPVDPFVSAICCLNFEEPGSDLHAIIAIHPRGAYDD